MFQRNCWAVSSMRRTTPDDTLRGCPRSICTSIRVKPDGAIRALCKYYDVTGEKEALNRAERGARWALSARLMALDDNISMTRAFLAL